jgi:low temperature requirement protein LtrA
MNLTGAAIGVIAFVIIGVFHPIVIKCEYYFTDSVWPVFLVFGILSLVASVFAANVMASSVLGILGCVFLWSIHELKEQRQRVEKGWFPENPNRGRLSARKDKSMH